MNTIADLDHRIAQMARTLIDVPKPGPWQEVRVCTRITPDGSTSSQSFELRDASGRVAAGWFPPDAAMDHLFDLARACWTMAAGGASAPWYGMTVRIRPDGSFSTDFEYRQDYREGDISRER